MLCARCSCFNSQYQKTNSRYLSLYISYRSSGETVKISRKFILGEHVHYSADNARALVGQAIDCYDSNPRGKCSYYIVIKC